MAILFDKTKIWGNKTSRLVNGIQVSNKVSFYCFIKKFLKVKELCNAITEEQSEQVKLFICIKIK